MKEETEKGFFCYNLKVSDPQCLECIWLEWSERTLSCLNRKKMICSLHIEEIFGNLTTNTIN
jgi:hypothetical protein